MKPLSPLGARIDSAVKARKMGSVGALAARAGYSPTYVYELRKNRNKNPGIQTIANLAKALDVPAAWLAFGEGDGPG